MQNLTLAQVADILETSTIENTIDHVHTIAHSGITAAGHRFVLINSYSGESFISYSP